MNAFLAQLFSFFNAVVGFLVVMTGILVAYAFVTETAINGYSISTSAPIAIIAIISAIVLAVLMCGLIALIAEIERHLRELKEIQSEGNKYRRKLSERVDPRLDNRQ